MKNGYLSLAILVVLAAAYPTGLAHAYLDPGTGSYFIQVVIGVVFGAAYTLRSFGGRLLTGFKKQPAKKESSDETAQSDTHE